ncbi:MAG: CRISPR-associated helicase Cas3' [Candidatus Delongbacteria bacterium]|nr:CRISPR-associated helicase Cas3' [Candidatus Delongbacteria bacterium]
MLYSHPGVLLLEHLKNVRNVGLKAHEQKCEIFLNYGDDLKTSIDIMLYYHDLGKSTKYFQDYILNNNYNSPLSYKNHALVSACIAAYKTYNTVKKTNRVILSTVVFISIAKHHGDFEEIEKMLVITDFKTLEVQYNSLQVEELEIELPKFSDLQKFSKDLFFNTIQGIDNYLLLNYFFSLLTYSDKSAAAFDSLYHFEQTKIPFQIVDVFMKKFENLEDNQLNRLRKDIYIQTEERICDVAKSKILTINVPTGTGKTLTVINGAIKLLRENVHLKRIIYALPFTSVIDQTAEVIKDIFGTNHLNSEDFLILHHHLAEAKIKHGEDYIEGDKGQLLIENWEKPLILTTFWQLFYSLFTNDNRKLRKFHNFANSVIILDEVQTIPYKYWKLINIFFNRFAETMNSKIVLLTATMPFIFKPDVDRTFDLIGDDLKRRSFQIVNRYNLLKLNNLDEINLEFLINHAIEKIDKNRDRSFLFVFNTIASSKLFYDSLKDLSLLHDIIYLSTSILPKHRKEKINKIRSSNEPIIVVSTQLIEAGVDIDLDIVYRDLAPLDSIIQTAGRCNRNFIKQKGDVYLFKLKKDDSKKRDSNYIYDAVLLKPTADALRKISSLEESSTFDFIAEYFKEIGDTLSNDMSDTMLKNVEILNYNEILNNFKLINEDPKSLVFVEIDATASSILKKYNKLSEIEDRWERKSEFLKIKNEFLSYCISIRYNKNEKISEFEISSGFLIIPSSIVNSYYNEETGFQRPETMIF